MAYENSVIVIGNGESRSPINLKALLGTITLIGCNAIHRDLNVNHLVCCDNRMVYEATTRKKSHKIKNIYTRTRYYTEFIKLKKNTRVKLLPKLPYEGQLKADQPEHWGSGPYALLLAVDLGYTNVYVLGFDLFSKTTFVNNIYKNTKNYLEEHKPAVDPAYWIYQIRRIFLAYPNVNFKIFNDFDWQFPDDWKLPNVFFFDLNKFHIELAKEVNISYNNSTEALDAQPS